jgi:hypothetical protein
MYKIIFFLRVSFQIQSEPLKTICKQKTFYFCLRVYHRNVNKRIEACIQKNERNSGMIREQSFIS